MSPTTRVLSAGELKALAVRRDAPAAWRAFGHVGAIALSGTALWFALGSVWALPLTVLHGYLVAFLFTAEHEAAHQTAFLSRRWNYAIGHAAALPILLPYEYYRAFHWDHHRYTQNPDRDPELYTPLPTSRLGFAWYLTGLPVWYDRLRMLVAHGVLGQVNERWVAADKRAVIVREARACLVVYAIVIALSLAFRTLAAVWLWIVPLLIGQLFLRPYLLAEHTGCSHTSDMLENTRTTYTNMFVRYFAWNMPYHAEHHAYPAVPFHALPQLNARLAEHISNSGRGYRGSTASVLRHLRDRREASGRTPASSSD